MSESEIHNIKFKKNSIVDRIMIELIKSYYELKNVNDSLDNHTIESSNISVREWEYKKRMRKSFLTEKVNYLSGLLIK